MLSAASAYLLQPTLFHTILPYYHNIGFTVIENKKPSKKKGLPEIKFDPRLQLISSDETWPLLGMSAFPQSEMRSSKDTPSATPLPLVAQFKVPRSSHARHEYTISSFAASGPGVNRSCSFQPAAALNLLHTAGINRKVHLHAEKVCSGVSCTRDPNSDRTLA